MGQILKEQMIRLNDRIDSKALAVIRELYEAAFPENEKKPFEIILDRWSSGLVEILALTDESDEVCGLAITAHNGDVVLLDYFAVIPQKRGMGIGSLALKLLQKRYTGRRLVLEIEDDAVPADNTAERIRRKRFYLKCGMEQMDYRVLLFGVEMLIFSYGGAVSFEEYHELLSAVFSNLAAKNARKM